MRAYEGPARASSGIAVVHDDIQYYGLVTRKAQITKIDGEERKGWNYKVELLPGVHTLGIHFTDIRFSLVRWANSPCFTTFRAEAGHEYKINSESLGDSWRIWLVDQQTGTRCDCLYEQKNKDPARDRPDGA
jgi:hypothetical protein